MEKKLIGKMAEKWADFRTAVGHSKIAKRLATIALAGVMAMPVALCASSCSGVDIKDNGDGSYTVTPKPNEGGNNNQQGNNQGGTDKPTTPDYSKFSPLLRSVLTNPEYDELYRKYESGEIGENATSFDGGVNLLEAIPYDFLASKGEDIEGIKNGAVAVGSDLYASQEYENYIFNKLDVIYKVNNGESYVNQYLLKYQITEQELDDLIMLYNGDYYQGPVMFQELASQRQPEVISEFSITEKAYNDLINSLNKNPVVNENFGNNVSGYVVTDYSKNADNEKDYDLRLKLISSNTKVAVSKGYIADMSLKVDRWAKPAYSNGIIDWTSIHNLYFNEQVGTSTPITYFHLSHSFKNVKTKLN